jgi:hypothetical protein
MALTTLTRCYILLLILSASFARQLLFLARDLLGQNTIAVFTYLIFLSLIIFLIPLIIRNFSLSKFCGSIVILTLGFYCSLFLEVYEERIHLVEYGILGILLATDLSSASLLKTSLITLLYGATVGITDELFQALLPYRVGDPRDVIFDCCGVLWGVMLWLALSSSPSRH